jgi:hypothetical protein
VRNVRRVFSCEKNSSHVSHGEKNSSHGEKNSSPNRIPFERFRQTQIQKERRRRPSTMARVVVSKTVKLKVTMNSLQSTHPSAVSFSGRQYIFELAPLVGCARGTR